MSQRCVDHHEVELCGEGCCAHVVTSARRCAVITFWDNWYSCSCWRHWWRGRGMSLMERMLSLKRLHSFGCERCLAIPDSRAGTSRKGQILET